MAKASKPASVSAKSRSQGTGRVSIRAGASKAPAGARSAEPPRTEWATDLVFDVREPKLAVSLRLDADVLRFFRGFGSGYQTRINEVLKAFMQARGGADNGAHAIPPSRIPRAPNGNGAGKRAR